VKSESEVGKIYIDVPAARR